MVAIQKGLFGTDYPFGEDGNMYYRANLIASAIGWDHDLSLQDIQAAYDILPMADRIASYTPSPSHFKAKFRADVLVRSRKIRKFFGNYVARPGELFEKSD